MYDVAIIGAGIAGMATAARLQAAGLSTLVLEAHGQVGGCAGFYRRRGFSFDVGATTLVDFEPGGVGHQLLRAIGMPPVEGERLPGYSAWLPDRKVTLYRDQEQWSAERLALLGGTPAHRKFWQLLDRLAHVFWQASRMGVKLPICNPSEIAWAVKALGVTNLPLVRYLNWTMGDALRHFGLRHDLALVGLLSMLIEDTVHSSIDQAPLINSALGITIRGAGLTRAQGGMRGFWKLFCERYLELGGHLQVGCRVTSISGGAGEFTIDSRKQTYAARQVVSSLPIELTERVAPAAVSRKLSPFLQRDQDSHGGAAVLFLGVPEAEVAGQEFTHHQLMHDYNAPLGNGNNMFISVSAATDRESAPAGCRAVMISTHCDLAPWQGLPEEGYQDRKATLGRRLLDLARRVYPHLGENATVHEVATPRTYERFTHRPAGAVGGVRQTLGNSNQRAVPHEIGVTGFHLAGDTTWPGLGTVACVLDSRIVAENVLRQSMTWPPSQRATSIEGLEEPTHDLTPSC